MVIEKKRKYTTHKYNTRYKNMKNRKILKEESDNEYNIESDKNDEEWLPNNNSSESESDDNESNYDESNYDESDDNETDDNESDDNESDDNETSYSSSVQEIVSKNKKQKFDNEKYTKLLSELFPSKYMNNRVKKDSKNNNITFEIIELDKYNNSKRESKNENESDYESDYESKNNNLKSLARKLVSKNKINNDNDNDNDNDNNNVNVNDIKEKKSNLLELKKLLKVKNTTNAFTYFKTSLTNEEQKSFINMVKDINDDNDDLEKPQLFRFLQLNIPKKYKKIALNKFEIMSNIDSNSDEYHKINNWFNIFISYSCKLLELDIKENHKEIAFKKLNTLCSMDRDNGEYYKIKEWIDSFMNIPFNKQTRIPITLDNDISECHEYMSECKKTLDNTVYGMNNAKLQVMQLIGQWIVNPMAIGTAIAIKGPMGVGKTTLVKDGISKILNMPFNIIALGGASDGSYLEGSAPVYEGSSPGKIVDILIQRKTSNPIIFFDELDKLSDTPKGDEITGILTHLTDTTQNTNFHDKYFSEIDFDLSKALFIFSYNDESKVNPILLDRMYKIEIAGYESNYKILIAKKYLLPKIYQQIKINEKDIIFTDSVLKYIIENYTEQEDGVRNLKRSLEIIFTKLNLFRLMKPEENLFEEIMSIKIEFPLSISEELVDKLIKNTKKCDEKWKLMYM